MSIKVPEGMLDAARSATKALVYQWEQDRFPEAFKAALEWQDRELEKMIIPNPTASVALGFNQAIGRVRLMFLDEPEVPEEIAPFIEELDSAPYLTQSRCTEMVIEAYRRGQKRGAQ
jgi:hypothetical protein